MEPMRPWWDGGAWRLDPCPPGVAPAPLGEDRWPLVVVPAAVGVAALLTVVQGAALGFAGIAALVSSKFGESRLAAIFGLLVVLSLLLVVAGVRLPSLRPRPRATVTAVELLYTLAAVMLLVGGATWAAAPLTVSVLLLVMLASPVVDAAHRAANTAVPYPDLPRLPRVVGRA